MEECFRRRINEEFEKGTAEKNKRAFLVMLLRLRQAATHPFLLEGMMDQYFSIEDIRSVRKQLAELKGGKTIYEQIGSWIQRHKMCDERMQKIMDAADRRKQESAEAFNRDDVEDYEDEVSDQEQSADMDQAERGLKQTHDTDAPTVANDNAEDETNSVDDIEEDMYGMVPGIGPVASSSMAKSNDKEVGERNRQSSREVEIEEDPLSPFGESDFGLNFDMDKQMEYMERVRLLDNAKCSVCNHAPRDPMKGSVSYNFHFRDF